MSAETPDPATIAALRKGMKSLRKLDRAVFLAHRVDAIRYVEIAAVTGLTVDQVEHRLARALYELDRYRSGYRPPWWRRWLR